MANAAAKYAATNRNSLVPLNFDDLRPHSVYAVANHMQSCLRFVVAALIVALQCGEPASPMLPIDLCHRPTPTDSHSFALSFAVESNIYSCS